MNYEDLYQALTGQEKAVKDRIGAIQRIFKAICRETESGDVKSLTKNIDAMRELVSGLSRDLDQVKETVLDFDAAAYFREGDFAEQMLSICREEQVDVQGSFPVYEMFPYRVKLDVENQDLYLDRKKVACMRPKSFVAMVKKGQERLNKAAFQEQGFLNELAEAYDLALLKDKKRPGYDVYLKSLYKLMAPMSRYRKEYDLQSFAFDLARLYGSDVQETKNGRRFQFGPSRNSSKAIRILDRMGQEQYLSTICFYEKEQ